MKNIVIIGGGHAGVEAASAISRLNHTCTLVTMDKNAIGRMSCNPAIGGLAKGHLVREIDALGGIMGEAADRTSIQFKTLNKSKGRAVWSPRAQVDKVLYSNYIKTYISKDKNINIVTGEVVDIIVNNNKVTGCLLACGKKIVCEAIIITSGTFLNGKIHIGRESYSAGRFAEQPSVALTDSLLAMGFETHRLKTGTPPRLLASSIDWKKLNISLGDEIPDFFSIKTSSDFKIKNTPCYTANTNSVTHKILQKNLSSSAMYGGKINAIGPRYCPSIEDKVVRFNDKNEHQLFLEPEWENAKQIYLNGYSTSMPKEVQIKSLRSIHGLENVELIRPGYAIEYDYFPSRQLKSTLESKNISGLYLAGQMNGTSGYEEAAAQGLMAGINSVLSTYYNDALVLSRTNSYIGVLIDDLITKEINEPYRMFTSRAEHRLYLRQDNADLRLTGLAADKNIITKKHLKKYNKFIKEYGKIKKTLIKDKIKIKNKSISYWEHLKNKDANIYTFPIINKNTDRRILLTLESESKYEGYIQIQTKKIEKIKKLENTLIPKNFSYNKVKNLSMESLEKLQKVKPETLAQAMRIDGVRQSDIASLTFHLYKNG